jgi:hypothetical protein
MANPPCMNEDGNEAVFTGTFFTTGQSVMLCADDMITFCATIVEGMTGVPVASFIQEFNEAAAQAAESDISVTPQDVEVETHKPYQFVSDDPRCPSCGEPLELVDGDGDDDFYGCATEGLTFDLGELEGTLANEHGDDDTDSTTDVN